MIIKDLKVVYSEEQIAARVRELAQEINRLYKGEPLVVVCVLKGAFMFFTDLVRHLDMHPELDFVRLASYGDATHRGSTISFLKDVEVKLEGKHVLIVEDIVDTGHTMDFLFRQLAARGGEEHAPCGAGRQDRTARGAGARRFRGICLAAGLHSRVRTRLCPEVPRTWGHLRGYRGCLGAGLHVREVPDDRYLPQMFDAL